MAPTITLTAAPTSERLAWGDRDIQPPTHVKCLPEPQNSSADPANDKPEISKQHPMATDRLLARSMLPKLNLNSASPSPADAQPTEFFSPSDFAGLESPSSEISCSESQPSGASAESTSEALNEFYDLSFTVHAALPSSQLGEIFDAAPGTPIYESNEEMFPSGSERQGGIMRSPSQRRLSSAPRPKILTELSAIPNAHYLCSIQPRTMTVNLIVGILSISPTKKVITGRQNGRPREVEFIELMVGDNTKTGFNITMWLPKEMHVNWKDGANAMPEGSRSELRRNLKMLRSRDIVMLQNVALSSYRGRVHGQSLRKDVTKIDLLFRRAIDDSDPEGIYRPSNLRNPIDPQIKKVKAVRDWLLESAGEGKKKRGHKLLPAYTP
ncbi:hypothetical protein DV735_g3966, partial [Chaetothyriales sp. CBS 134920]